jgi:hypothetical protein
MQKNQSHDENLKVQHYRAYGLSIHSDLPLPELITDQAHGPADVHIRYERERGQVFASEDDFQHFIVAPDQVILKAEGFQLAITQGKKITIHCHNPNLYQDAIRLRILGAGLGVLLQQREHLVLHGATIVGQRGAVVIMGNSGDGKSTLTMQLVQGGYRLSGDDKCVMKVDVDRFTALSGSPYIKINDRLVTQTGIHKDRIHSVRALKNKVYVDLSSKFEIDQVPIVAGFVLGQAHKTLVEKLTQRQAFDSLIEHSYRKKKLFRTVLQKTHFLQCHSMAVSVPVYAYSRQLVGEHLRQPEPEFLDLLEDLIGSGR